MWVSITIEIYNFTFFYLFFMKKFNPKNLQSVWVSKYCYPSFKRMQFELWILCQFYSQVKITVITLLVGNIGLNFRLIKVFQVHSIHTNILPLANTKQTWNLFVLKKLLNSLEQKIFWHTGRHLKTEYTIQP